MDFLPQADVHVAHLPVLTPGGVEFQKLWQGLVTLTHADSVHPRLLSQRRAESRVRTAEEREEGMLRLEHGIDFKQQQVLSGGPAVRHDLRPVFLHEPRAFFAVAQVRGVGDTALVPPQADDRAQDEHPEPNVHDGVADDEKHAHLSEISLPGPGAHHGTGSHIALPAAAQIGRVAALL